MRDQLWGSFSRLRRRWASIRTGNVVPLSRVLLPLLLSGCASSGPEFSTEPIRAADLAAGMNVVKFVLGPYDEIDIKVWRNDDLNSTQKISPTGDLYLPLAGKVKAGGLSVEELREAIAGRLSEFIVNPQVLLTVVSYVSQKVFVLGEVNQPGMIPVGNPITAVEAISFAQGMTKNAAGETVMLIRGSQDQPVLALLDLESLLVKGNVTENVMLTGGDILYVPPTRISDVERFFARINTILRPFVTLENGIILFPVAADALSGDTVRTVISTGG